MEFDFLLLRFGTWGAGCMWASFLATTNNDYELTSCDVLATQCTEPSMLDDTLTCTSSFTLFAIPFNSHYQDMQTEFRNIIEILISQRVSFKASIVLDFTITNPQSTTSTCTPASDPCMEELYGIMRTPETKIWYMGFTTFQHQPHHENSTIWSGSYYYLP
jgi:hypothetical protein